MVPSAGIEPASADYKSAALPLSENSMKQALGIFCTVLKNGQKKTTVRVHRGL